MKNKIIYIAVLGLLALSACTKVININLNSANTQLVIEGLVSNIPGIPDTVKLSKTVNFFAQSVYPPVSGARVVISDNSGVTDTLKEVVSKPGYYITSPSRIKGQPGNAYTLSVFTTAINGSGQTFTATSTMPAKLVNIDSIGQTESLAMRFGRGGRPGDTTYNVTVHWRDPAGISNYYCGVLFYNDTMLQRDAGYTIGNDKYSDGLEVDFLFAGHAFHRGDTARVELRSIDQSTYNYYNMLNGIINGANGPNSASPTNPISNVSTGAVGYFSAYSVSVMTYIIK